MKNLFKKIGALCLAVAMVITMMPAKEVSAAKINNKKLTIYCWDEDGKSKMQYFLDKYPQYKKQIVFKNLNVGGTSDDYKKAIKRASGIVLVDESMLEDCMKSSQYADLASIGFKGSYYKNAYTYTKQRGTYKKKLKAVTWQATPGCFVYNCKVAREVLGTDNPAVVQKYVKDWKTFENTAKLMANKNYSMLYSSGEIETAFGQVNSKECKAEKAKFKNYFANNAGFTWDDKWMGSLVEPQNSKVFGYFGCTWFTSVIDSMSEGTGDFNICEGPANYYWGGTYVMVTKNCQNPALAALVLKTVCGDTQTMKKMYTETYDFPNNQAAVKASLSFKPYKCIKYRNYNSVLNNVAKKTKYKR